MIDFSFEKRKNFPFNPTVPALCYIHLAENYFKLSIWKFVEWSFPALF
jgi:hypothetical protein